MFDTDGLVASPRSWFDRTVYDAPIWRDYRWVAMLDPAELADGENANQEPGPAVVVDALGPVEHHSRPAWEATLRTTPFYYARCTCCPLLHSAESDARESAGGVPSVVDRMPGFRFADAHRVRLDVETGVCVFTAEIGGTQPGDGHDLQIEEVDGEIPT